MKGSRVRIWKQDSSSDPSGFATMYIPIPVQDGPRDDEIVVALDSLNVKGNCERDFLFDPVNEQREFDATHTFAVVRHVVTTYKRILSALGKKFSWHWGNFEPLRVLPYSVEGRPAHYAREDRTLHFSSHQSTTGHFKGQTINACQHFDIVAHQTGHAILDSVNPELATLGTGDADTIALRETFADLAILFSSLARMDECERVLVETKGELFLRNSLCTIGRPADQAQEYLWPEHRSLDPALWATQTSLQPHERSVLLTGAVYRILSRIWIHELERDPSYPAETLYLVARDLSRVVVQAFLPSWGVPATLLSFANQILLSEQDPVRRAIILEQLRLWRLV